MFSDKHQRRIARLFSGSGTASFLGMLWWTRNSLFCSDSLNNMFVLFSVGIIQIGELIWCPGASAICKVIITDLTLSRRCDVHSNTASRVPPTTTGVVGVIGTVEFWSWLVVFRSRL